MVVNGVDYATLLEIEKKYNVEIRIDSLIEQSELLLITVRIDLPTGVHESRRFKLHYINQGIGLVNSMTIAGVLTCIENLGIKVEGGITW